MHPLSFVMVFLFQALFMALGIALVGVGTVKLRRRTDSGVGTRGTILAVSGQSSLVAGGLLLGTFGIYGVYRIIWGF